jgi:transcriptional regulator with XRE-family HTH domain
VDPLHPRPASDASRATPRLVPWRAHQSLEGPGSPAAEPVGEGAEGHPEDAEYRDRLGARLRAVRRSQGLRLQDVEQLSGGRFKAVVIGSYERGDRAIATHKLAMLADFYGVPVSELLPDDGWIAAPGRATESLQLSVPALYEVDDAHDVDPLRRLVQHIQSLRGDHGLVVTLRREDLRTIAVTLGVEVGELPAWLETRGLTTRH